MNFGAALEELKKGVGVTLPKWNENGEKSYILFIPVQEIQDKRYQELTGDTRSMKISGYAAKVDLNSGYTVVGWSPSYDEMVSEEWTVV